MMKAWVLLACLLAGVTTFQFDTKSKEKGPTLTVNCGCQCSSPSLTFQDASGQVQGNCRSADSEGGVWCYVDSGEHSTCRDLRPSNRFPGHPWSYEACTSPPSPSPACPDTLCRGDHCDQQPLCRHLGNCGSLPPPQQSAIQPIHLPILGAITGAILGAIGGAHHHPPPTTPPTLPPTPPPTTPSTLPPPTKPTVVPSPTTTTPAPTSTTTTTTTSTTTTTTTTSTTTTQAPDPWLNQVTINPPSNLVQGTWGPMELCPTSTYVSAFELLVAPLCDRRCALDDDVGLMGVRLHCSTLPTPAASPALAATVTSAVTANITRVGGGSVLGYSWTSPTSCPASTFTSGARLLTEFFILETTTIPGIPNPPGCPTGAICRPPSQQSSDPAGGLNMDMRCTSGTALPGPGIPPRTDISAWGEERSCPPDMAVCGVRTKIEEGLSDLVSNLGLTDVMLQCCQLPAHLAQPALIAPSTALIAPSTALAPNLAPSQFGPPPRRAQSDRVVFG